ncbi:MAG TPA: response regulator [Candidatus Nanopelagicaceae bacterium]|nr:response regulator [Candidatus Nanopelagicaceae bacterium]
MEDDLSLQKLYEMMISTFGFRVVGKANNGKEAIEKYYALTNKPDVILMDHRMPVQNGIDTAIILLKLKKPPKIIFTSADISIKTRALAIDGLTFLEKPFTVKALHDEIIKVLGIS